MAEESLDSWLEKHDFYVEAIRSHISKGHIVVRNRTLTLSQTWTIGALEIVAGASRQIPFPGSSTTMSISEEGGSLEVVLRCYIPSGDEDRLAIDRMRVKVAADGSLVSIVSSHTLPEFTGLEICSPSEPK